VAIEAIFPYFKSFFLRKIVVDRFSKYLLPACIVLILLLGFGLRSYHFSDWLHFELDQARDVRVVDAALSGGPGELTLLGPKAAGTFLRLPPTFYYLQYMSGLTFGGSPSGMAVFVLLFSVGAIALFFLLVRRFFSLPLALGLMLLFAVSHYFVMYGRFAWNPNLLPFFILLGFYALLRAVDETDSKRDRFFILALGSSAVATHFHFLAFLALPLITGLFLIYKRPHFTWKTWVIALSLALFSYFPMVLNDLKAGGTNTAEFFAAITEKSSKGDDHVFIEKFMRDIAEHALHAVVVTTGFEGATFPSFFMEDRLRWNCPDKCDDGKWYGVSAALFLVAAFVSLGFLWWRETEAIRRDFLVLTGIWFGVTFSLFLPLAYAVAPRFFLISGPLFFIFIGVLLTGLAKCILDRRIAIGLGGIVIALFTYSNLHFLFNRFSELGRASSETVENRPDRILKERVRVTLEQQEVIVNFLERRSREMNVPIYMFSEPQYRRAIKYLLKKRGIENDALGFSSIYRQGSYYLIIRSQSNIDGALEKYRPSYAVGARTYFGTLVAIELIPFEDKIVAERQDFSVIEKRAVSSAPPRYTWNEFFSVSGTSSKEEDEDIIEEDK